MDDISADRRLWAQENFLLSCCSVVAEPKVFFYTLSFVGLLALVLPLDMAPKGRPPLKRALEMEEELVGPATSSGSGDSVKCGPRGPTRVGSMDWEVKKARMPPGPSSVQELYEWPVQHFKDLDTHGGPEWGVRLFECLMFGAEVKTDYSGADFVREAFSIVGQQFMRELDNDNLVFKPPFTFVRSCDNQKLQQSVLCDIAKQIDGDRSCVFADIGDRLPPVIAKRLDEIENGEHPRSAAQEQVWESRYTVGKMLASTCTTYESTCKFVLRAP